MVLIFMTSTQKNSSLSHMTASEIVECYEMYRNNEMKNSEIIELYGLEGINANTLLKHFPMLPTQKPCPLCESQLLEVPTGKTAYSRQYECSVCHHYVYSDDRYHPDCTCERCVLVKKEEARKKQQEIELRYKKNLALLVKRYLVPENHIDFSSLTLIEKIYLASVISLGNNKYIPSKHVASINSLLSAAGILDKTIYTTLIDKNIIYPVMGNLEKFKIINFNEQDIEYSLIYHPNVLIDDGLSDCETLLNKIFSDFESIKFSSVSIKTSEAEQLFNLIEQIEVAESVVFLSDFCRDVDLPEPPKKTYDVIRKMLTEISVSELVPFIYRAVKDASHYYVTGKSKGKKHAVNTIPNHIESSVAHYKNNDWELKKWNRSRNIEKSNLSCVVYDKLLVNFNLGFYQSVSDIFKILQQHLKPVLLQDNTHHMTISDEISTSELLCKHCESSHLQFLESEKGMLIFCLDCNGTELL